MKKPRPDKKNFRNKSKKSTVKRKKDKTPNANGKLRKKTPDEFIEGSIHLKSIGKLMREQKELTTGMSQI